MNKEHQMVVRRRDIMMRAEINNIDTKNTIQIINMKSVVSSLKNKAHL